MLLSRGTNLVAMEANPSGLTAGGAGFALAQAMGAQPGLRTERLPGGCERRADVALTTSSQDWLGANDTAPKMTNQALYNRTDLAGQYIGTVAPNNSKMAAAAKLAEVVGSHGAEAEAVIGPTARKTAYRYRGTEKTPDPHIVNAYNRAIRTAKLTGASPTNVELEAAESLLAVRAPATGGRHRWRPPTGGRPASRASAVAVRSRSRPDRWAQARATAEAALREARPPTWAGAQSGSEGDHRAAADRSAHAQQEVLRAPDQGWEHSSLRGCDDQRQGSDRLPRRSATATTTTCRST